MENTMYKGMDYLRAIKKDNYMTSADVCDMLYNIACVLHENGFSEAGYFIDNVVDAIEDREIVI